MDPFDIVFERIQKVVDCRTQVELAEVLGIRQSSVSDAKKRGSIPSEWIIKIFSTHGVNPNWIMHGIEPIFIDGRNENNNLLPKNCKFTTIKIINEKTSDIEDTTEKFIIPDGFENENILVIKLENYNMKSFSRKLLIGIRPFKDENKIYFGQMYLTKDEIEGINLKTVLAKNDYLLFVDDNFLTGIDFPMCDKEEILIGRVIWIMTKM